MADEAGNAAAHGDDERGARVANLLKGGVLFVKARPSIALPRSLFSKRALHLINREEVVRCGNCREIDSLAKPPAVFTFVHWAWRL